MADLTALTNGRIITPIQVVDGGAVLIEEGVIADLGPAGRVRWPEGARVIDLKGAYVSPGFVDLHLHGAWGGDVMAGSVEGLRKMAACLPRGGVTSFLPTTLSGPLAQIARAVEAVEEASREGGSGARILGVHLEGPYFSLSQKGAQNPEHIIPPRPEDYLPLLDRHGSVIRVSAAPEIPGGLDLGRELRKRGIVASIGHSSATYQEVLRAVEAGYTHVTHIFSGMSTVQRVQGYRIAGVLESALVLDELTTEMIADGHHLPPSLMRLVLKAKGLDKVCLVTDAMAAAGLGPGSYRLGGLDVLVEGEIPAAFEIPAQKSNCVAKLADRSAFSGSVATMNQLVRNMVQYAGLGIQDAVRLATINPARMQRLEDRLGLLAPGRPADLTVFDERIEIKLTMVGGSIVYDAGADGGSAARP